jgi:hypothetical protein
MGDNKSFQILRNGVSVINGRQHLRPRVGPRSAAWVLLRQDSLRPLIVARLPN